MPEAKSDITNAATTVQKRTKAPTARIPPWNKATVDPAIPSKTDTLTRLNSKKQTRGNPVNRAVLYTSTYLRFEIPSRADIGPSFFESRLILDLQSFCSNSEQEQPFPWQTGRMTTW